MAVHYRSPGIFIKKEDRGEADQVFTIYTKDFGKLRVLGKAIRKSTSKLRAGAELFYLSEIEFIQGKVYKTLTDVILVDKFKEIRNNLKKLAVVFKISEVLDELIKEQEPDKKIWQLLEKTFERLNASGSKKTAYVLEYHYFFWNLLSVSGYQPEFHNCFFCGKKLLPGKIHFYFEEGGLACLNCFNKTAGKHGGRLSYCREISLDTIKIIRMILKRDWKTLAKLKITPLHQKELKAVSKNFFSAVLSSDPLN